MRGLPRRGSAVLGLAAGAILLATSLAGCSAIDSILPGGGALPALSSIAGTSTSPPLEHYSDGSTSERGNIPKVVGQKAGELSADGQTRLFTFTVTRILPDPRCLNQAAPAPTNGHYVEVDIQVITTAALAEDGDPTVTFTPDNWFQYPHNPDGQLAGGVGAVGADDHCELSVPALPDSIGPAQTVSGSVLLDVAAGTAYISFNPGHDCGCSTSWEWPYPTS